MRQYGTELTVCLVVGKDRTSCLQQHRPPITNTHLVKDAGVGHTYMFDNNLKNIKEKKMVPYLKGTESGTEKTHC